MKNVFKKKSVIICLIIFIIGVPVMSLLLVHNMYGGNFGRVDAPVYTGWLQYDDLDGYDREEVQFESGDNKLAGYIYGAENTRGLVVIAHGLGGGAENYLAETVYFVDAGWKVFAYDCTGSYHSEGDSTKGLSQSALDLDAALTYIETQNWDLPVMLYGHSWGGYAVTAVLNYDHDITAAVSLSGYAAPIELLDEQAGQVFGWLSKVMYPFEVLYQKILFGDAAGLSAIKGINSDDTPVMVIHGTEDSSVQYDGASIIAHKDEITNPNVVYITRNEEGRDGHNTLYRSETAVEYVSEVNEAYDELNTEYEGEIPEEEKKVFYAGVDKFRTSELDVELMDEIHQFFEDSLK